MLSVEIFLVRHGEAAAGWGQSRDPGLSELGMQQAQQVATELGSQLDPEVQLVSSPLARARETAQPLAAKLSLAVEIDEAFQEIPAPVPMSQRQPWLRRFMHQTWEGQPQELLAWREAAVQQVLGRSGSAVIFTHFLVINAIVGRVLERPETLCFWPDNGSITHLSLQGGNLELVCLGRQMVTVVN